MGHQYGGGRKPDIPTFKLKGEKLSKALVVEDVRVIETTKEVVVPKIVTKTEEQTKYNTIIQDQVKYNTIEKDTTKYIPKEVPTTKYNVTVEDTIKYNTVEKDLILEKPVLVDKPYERPVIKEKEYTVATIKDMENVRALMNYIPKMLDGLNKVMDKLKSICEYKLVEKIVEAPKITWVNTPVERIVWKDVERSKP